MSILFFIFSRGQASGGHYHSCDQISRALGDHITVNVITIGPDPSSLLAKNPNFKEHLFYKNPFDSYGLNKALKKYEEELAPDIIHCFDTESYNVILPLPVFWNKKILLTKCGGPNPHKSNWQHADGLILFSMENYKWFKDNPNYSDSTLHLISNRVAGLKHTPAKQRREQKEEGKFSFVRISRLGGAYEKTLQDTFRLVEELKEAYDIRLYVIGRIQNEERFNLFKNEAEDKALPIYFITDERASKASQFLYLADCVVGTGRSFMEAVSLGIPTLTPAQNSNIPVLVNKRNFNTFFKTNFSERNVADESSLALNKAEIIKLIEDQDFHQQIAQDAYQLFKENFDTSGIKDKYLKVYKICLENKVVDRFKLIRLNILYLIKGILTR